MDRKKIIAAILKADITKLTHQDESVLFTCLRYLSDTNLLSLAIDLGIDTDAILTEVK